MVSYKIRFFNHQVDMFNTMETVNVRGFVMLCPCIAPQCGNGDNIFSMNQVFKKGFGFFCDSIASTKLFQYITASNKSDVLWNVLRLLTFRTYPPTVSFTMQMSTPPKRPGASRLHQILWMVMWEFLAQPNDFPLISMPHWHTIQT